MKKYYVDATTTEGDVILTIRAKNEQEAKERLFSNYKIISLNNISTKPSQFKTEPMLLFSNPPIGISKYQDVKKSFSYDREWALL